MKTCPKCGKPLNYDSFEDCYLCIQAEGCQSLFYPKDFGEQNNPEAGIWKLGSGVLA